MKPRPISHGVLGGITALAVMTVFTTGAVGAAKRTLTVADSIETTRMMVGAPIYARSADGSATRRYGETVFVSPDGKRYAVMLIRGDLKRNGNEVEIVTGRLDSLEVAARLETAVRLFTRSLGTGDGYGSSELTAPGQNPLVWLDDNERVAFFWEDKRQTRQVVAVNVQTREVEFLTRHPTDVIAFAAHRGMVLYTAKLAHTQEASQRMLRSGFVVTNPDVISLLRGEIDGYGTYDKMFNSEWFIARVGQAPRKVSRDGREHDLWASFLAAPQFSPNGRLVIVDATPAEIPSGWNKYTPKKADHLSRVLQCALNAFPRDECVYGKQIKQLYIIDTEQATSRPLWDPPMARLTNGGPKLAWSPNGASVLVGPAFLPSTQANAAGLAGTAVAEVDVVTGRFRQVPVPAETEIGSLRWLSDRRIAIRVGNTELEFERLGEQWRADGRNLQLPESEDPAAAAIRIELRQDLNMPPALYAVEISTGREKLILDLNPKLRADFALGRVEHFQWKDEQDLTWSGLLYYPVGYTASRRFPLVIQTHGHAPVTEFNLYGKGPGLGPGWSVYAAQALANRDIAVLQMEDKKVPGPFTVTPREPEVHAAAYEAAVEQLAAKGLVNQNRVGLVGHSRTGWHVEYALTHSDFPYAAAIATDNMDASYLQATLMPGRYVDEIGAKPFGDGLKIWLERSPGFNADKVHTPLRLQAESHGLAGLVFQGWEMFSRLRQLGKPVEFYVAPDIEHGSHGLQNPAQVHAVQQGAVDWFDFWLNGREDPDPAKAEQYARWRKLRQLHEADLGNPHPSAEVDFDSKIRTHDIGHRPDTAVDWRRGGAQVKWRSNAP